MRRDSRRWVCGMDARSSAKRACRRGDKERVMAVESRDQPRICLRVSQRPSPLVSLETEMGSVREGGSRGSRGRKTSSMAFIMV